MRTMSLLGLQCCFVTLHVIRFKLVLENESRVFMAEDTVRCQCVWLPQLCKLLKLVEPIASSR